jgi:hypothetical protein
VGVGPTQEVIIAHCNTHPSALSRGGMASQFGGTVGHTAGRHLPLEELRTRLNLTGLQFW